MKHCLCLILSLCCAGCALFHRDETVTARETVSATGQTNTVYQTNVLYTVNPGVNAALNTGRSIAAESGPIGTLAAAAIGLVISGLGWVAKRKSDVAALVPTLIAGIETAPGNEAVKQTVKTLASATGLEERLNAVVRKVTK